MLYNYKLKVGKSLSILEDLRIFRQELFAGSVFPYKFLRVFRY